MVGAGIHSRLAADTGVTTIVPSARIYSADASQDNVYPLIAYKLEDQTTRTLNGTPKSKTYQLTVASVATDARVADTLKTAVLAALNVGSIFGVWGGINIQGCWFQEPETFETTSQEDQLHRFYIYEQNYKLMVY